MTWLTAPLNLGTAVFPHSSGGAARSRFVPATRHESNWPRNEESAPLGACADEGRHRRTSRKLGRKDSQPNHPPAAVPLQGVSLSRTVTLEDPRSDGWRTAERL